MGKKNKKNKKGKNREYLSPSMQMASEAECSDHEEPNQVVEHMDKKVEVKKEIIKPEDVVEEGVSVGNIVGFLSGVVKSEFKDLRDLFLPKKKMAVSSGDAQRVNLKELVVLDVTPMTLGIAEHGRFMHSLIKRNTVIPTKEVKYCCPASNDQTEVSIRVYEGESSLIENNKLLGEFDLTDIPSAPFGEQKLKITYEVDADGILNVSAEVLSTGKTEKITITPNKGGLSNEQVEMMAKQNTAEGEREEAKNDLEVYCLRMKKIVEDEKIKSEISSKDKKKIVKKCNETLNWLNKNPKAKKKDIEHHLKKIESVCYPVINLYEKLSDVEF